MNKDSRIKIVTNNWALKIGALFIAIIAWVLVVNADDPIVNRTFDNVPVNVINRELITNQGLTYRVDNDTTTVSVTVFARRSIMDRIVQTPEHVTATADFSQMQYGKLVPINATVFGFDTRIEEAIASPNNMSVTIEEVERRHFAINVNVTGRPREGFVVNTTEADPRTVNITGPASLITDIHRVVARINVDGMASTGVREAELVIYDYNGNAMDQSLLTTDISGNALNVLVEILPTKSVEIIFTTSGTPAQGFVVSDLTSEPSTISIAAREEVLENLTEITIPGEAVNIQGASSRMEIPVDITPFLPDGIQLADPEQFNFIVTVHIERAGTRTIVVPVEAIIIEGLDERFSVYYGDTTEIEIQFRGVQSILNGITPNNLVSIDLSFVTAVGEYTVPYVISLATDVENITVSNELTITIIPRERDITNN